MRNAVIVLPTYNEAGTVTTLIETIFETASSIENWRIAVLVVDSDSEDDTVQQVKTLQKKHRKSLHLLSTTKEGLGKAYVEGFTYATEHMNPYVLFEMDADLSHNPKDISQLLKKIEAGADLVIGSRYIKGGSIPKQWAPSRKFYSIVGNLIIKYGFMKRRVSDWTSGYRAIKVWVVKSALEHIRHYSGYVFQIALLDQAIKHRAHLAEVPIQFKDRTYGISKIDVSQYGSQTLFYVLSHSSFIRFCIVGGVGFMVDFSTQYLLMTMLAFAGWMSTLISTTLAVISNFTLNNFWSFSHKRSSRKRVLAWQFIKFAAVSLGSIGIQTTMVYLFETYFPQYAQVFIDILLYRIAVIAFMIIPYSYFFYNKVVWKER